MRRLSPVLNMQTLRIVYFAHFHSLVNYVIILWGNPSSIPNSKKGIENYVEIKFTEFLQKMVKELEFYLFQVCIFIH
jgi:hypothetical protein